MSTANANGTTPGTARDHHHEPGPRNVQPRRGAQREGHPRSVLRGGLLKGALGLSLRRPLVARSMRGLVTGCVTGAGAARSLALPYRLLEPVCHLSTRQNADPMEASHD
jgi:hypothetical protein